MKDLPIAEHEHCILEALARYDRLTAEQLARLLYQPTESAVKYVQKVMTRLVTDKQLCAEDFIPRPGRHGRPKTVYLLGSRGRRYLTAMGIPVKRYFRKGEDTTRSRLFLEHTREVNDFLITIERFSQILPGCELVRMLFEREMKANPLQVRNEHGKLISVLFDGWVHLKFPAFAPPNQYCLGIEIDRGTEYERKFRERIRTRVLADEGPYAESFGTNILTIAYLTTGGKNRLESLLAWTEAELTALNRRCCASLFCFIAADPAPADPRPFFLTPCWWQPWQKSPVYVLEGITDYLHA